MSNSQNKRIEKLEKELKESRKHEFRPDRSLKPEIVQVEAA